MYSVLIAEDELLVRIGLTASVPWEKMGMYVVEDVSDGQKALDAWRRHQPDILITDLSMPGMNGLSLLRAIRREDAHGAAVVVTCMDTSEALAEAASLGVVDCLIKATMTVSDIQKAVLKAKERVGAPREQNAGQRHVEKHATLEAFLVRQSIDFQTLDAQSRAHAWRLPQHAAALCVWFNRAAPISWPLQKTLQSMLANCLAEYQVLGVFQAEDNNLVVAVQSGIVKDDISARLDKYRLYIQDSFDVSVRIAACAKQIPLHDLPKSVALLRTLHARCGAFDDAILWVDEDGRLNDTACEAWFETLRLRAWTTHGTAWSVEAIRRIGALENACALGLPTFNASLLALAEWFAKISPAPKSNLDTFASHLSGTASIRQALHLFEILLLPQCPTYREEISRLIEHVLTHINGEFSLQQLAALVHMHPQYLSNLFKKETGVSFSDFLSFVRIEHAQRMLADPSISVARVSEYCGFYDLAYFCRRFKQKTGMTPSEWRRAY